MRWNDCLMQKVWSFSLTQFNTEKRWSVCQTGHCDFKVLKGRDWYQTRCYFYLRWKYLVWEQYVRLFSAINVRKRNHSLTDIERLGAKMSRLIQLLMALCVSWCCHQSLGENSTEAREAIAMISLVFALMFSWFSNASALCKGQIALPPQEQSSCLTHCPSVVAWTAGGFWRIEDECSFWS